VTAVVFKAEKYRQLPPCVVGSDGLILQRAWAQGRLFGVQTSIKYAVLMMVVPWVQPSCLSTCLPACGLAVEFVQHSMKALTT